MKRITLSNNTVNDAFKELNEYDITVLREFRKFSLKRRVLSKWKKNVLKIKKEGPVKANIFQLAELMFERSKGYSFIRLRGYNRMLTMLTHSVPTFEWAKTEEEHDFWSEFFCDFKICFMEKYPC